MDGQAIGEPTAGLRGVEGVHAGVRAEGAGPHRGPRRSAGGGERGWLGGDAEVGEDGVGDLGVGDGSQDLHGLGARRRRAQAARRRFDAEAGDGEA